jgi:sigma-B regulation protein RsbU (phosphoserine phosphatase)
MVTMAPELEIETQKTLPPRILIADDQQDVLDALRMFLKGHGFVIDTVSSPLDLLAATVSGDFDVILMDLNYARDTTSGREGLDLLGRLEQLHREQIKEAPPIVVMTGWATVGLAVETMQHGVGDFVEKPWNNARLLEILQKQIALGRERREARRQSTEENRLRAEAAAHFRQQERELAEARAIQEKLLPRNIAQIPGYHIAGTWQSAGDVGGDYFDVIPVDDRALAICIADVCGKGMPAALLMSNLQSAVRGLTSLALPPDALCARLNSIVCANTASDRFITFFYAQLDRAARRLSYVNAGHNHPFVVHRDGSHERLQAGGGVLGIFEDQTYSLGTAQLAPGDCVLLFTDGVTEACDSQGEEFGEQRLLHLLRESHASSLEKMQTQILAAVQSFSASPWADDATLLLLSVSE